MIAYIDTHVAVLITHSAKKLPRSAANTLRRAKKIRISPAVILELQMLREIGRLNVSPNSFIDALRESFELETCPLPFADVAEAARALSWTRDPFDRFIVAQASLAKNVLVTRDQAIRENFRHAVWD
ncbi:MAG: PIN domain-containing protein [Polyangiaceae bacterium]|nr:PIN domain-containing protein [Polyangiaceae bacterium]